jgi:hypothetical protein
MIEDDPRSECARARRAEFLRPVLELLELLASECQGLAPRRRVDRVPLFPACTIL